MSDVFALDASAAAWVKKTLAGMSTEHKAGQIVNIVCGWFDAFDMGGILEHEKTVTDAAVRGLAAGLDCLLLIRDLPGLVEAICRAVEDGRVPAERLDDACRRMLSLKARLGLHAPDYAVPDDVVNDPGEGATAKVAGRYDAIFYMFNNGPQASRCSIQPCRQALRDIDWTVINSDKPVIFVALRSPYLRYYLPGIPNLVCTYSNAASAQRALVKAILGEVPFAGRLPVKVPAHG